MPSEKELYSLLIDRPEEGLEKLMNNYMGYVYTIVHGQLSAGCRKRDIEECVSDVFFEIYTKRDRIDLQKGSLKTYLAMIARRTAIDYYRKTRKQDDLIFLDAYEHDWLASESDIEKEVGKKEEKDALISAIKSLGEPDSQIIIRKYYFRHTAKSIGKALGLKENTVNKRASRALAKIKNALEV